MAPCAELLHLGVRGCMLWEFTTHHPVITQTVFATNSSRAIGTRTFPDLLEADLATGVRGGNKHRLIARIWWHMHGHQLEGYEAWRTAQARRTFKQLHDEFDCWLPAQWQATR